MKVFKAGDKVRCINFDTKVGTRCWAEEQGCKIGDIYTVRDQGSFRWISIVEDPKSHDYRLEMLNFKLVESAEDEQPITNANVKMITTFVPAWAKWMAMDKNGSWYVFEKKPILYTNSWIIDDEIDTTSTEIFKIGRCDPKDIEVDWKETLHEI